MLECVISRRKQVRLLYRAFICFVFCLRDGLRETEHTAQQQQKNLKNKKKKQKLVRPVWFFSTMAAFAFIRSSFDCDAVGWKYNHFILSLVCIRACCFYLIFFFFFFLFHFLFGCYFDVDIEKQMQSDNIMTESALV